MSEQHRDQFGNPAPEPKPTAPRPLQLARVLWIVAVLVGFVRSYVQLSDRSWLINEVHRGDPGLSQTQVDAAANAGILSTLLLSLASLSVYVLLSTRMVQGFNWARIVLTVLGGLSMIGSLVTLLAILAVGADQLSRMTGVDVGVSQLVFGVAILGVDAAAIVMMFQPESNRFFREARGRIMAARISRTG